MLNRNIFDKDYKGNSDSEKQENEKKVFEQLEKVEACDDERLLIDMAVNHKKDIRVRLAASKKVQSQEGLDYLLLATTIVPNGDNFKVALSVAERSDNPAIVDEAMRSILFCDSSAYYHEYIEKAISCITSIALLEKFIGSAAVSSGLKDLAYERAMELMESEEP